MYEELKSLYDWMQEDTSYRFCYVFGMGNELSMRISSNISRQGVLSKLISEKLFSEIKSRFSDKKPGARVVNEVVVPTWRTNMVGSEFITSEINLLLRKQLISQFLEEK